MTASTSTRLDGRQGAVVVHHWGNAEARFVAIIAHGYAEHAGRYEHVAARLVREGAVVLAPDHAGHGLSDGERARVEDGKDLVADLHLVVELAGREHPDLPVALIGHSMGGLIATRYAQQHAGELAVLVLSGPVIGVNPEIEALLGMDPMPEVPIDPAVLSRDPAVGAAYLADPLVYSGPFKRETLEALFEGIRQVQAGPAFGELPVLWIHGEEDGLAPLAATRPAIEKLRGSRTEEKVYPEARHEIFNEINQDEVLDDVMGFLARNLD